jgi:predicted  nucleic acid-binding Zn-ribbon protein
MASLGKKYTCYSCHTKFYDLGKPEPLCPKCGANQRDAEDAPVVTSHRSRRVVEEPEEPEPEFGPEPEASEEPVDDEEAELVVPEKEAEEAEAEEEEEEEY